ncbi:unnamed protein product [Owenia fusiformis]|uniref:Uncharacterized protein n=1 Tax=Owenia fusiformis TaxID=6347 RepID=A0A8S4NKG5_OWEFU|nr:unnamed protein product [Owenia fusiformis]
MQSLSRMCLGVAVALVCSVLTEGRSLPKGSVDDRIANLFRRRWIGPKLSIDSVEDNRVANLLRRRGIGRSVPKDFVEDKRMAKFSRRVANGLLPVKPKRDD